MGADGFSASLSMRLDTRHLPASPYMAAITAVLEQAFNLRNGAGDETADRVFFQTGTIAISGNVEVDLQTALDGFGDALAATAVIALGITATSTNAAPIELTTGAANGWTGLVATGDVVRIRAGGSVWFIATKSGSRYPVSGTDKVLRINNTSGSSTAGYQLLVVTRD